jgi:hypothetical protein
MIWLLLAVLLLPVLITIDFKSNTLVAVFLLCFDIFAFYMFVCFLVELGERLLGIPYITITDEYFSYRSGAVFREDKTFYYSDIKKISFTEWRERKSIENSTFINIKVKENALEEDDVIDTTSLDTEPKEIYNILNEKLNSYNARAKNATV